MPHSLPAASKLTSTPSVPKCWPPGRKQSSKSCIRTTSTGRECYLGEAIPYPQGGRLNAAVNLPPEWRSKSTSGFDRFKAEALSWSAQYTNLTLATEAMSFPITSPMTWTMQDTAYLVPWFNGICAWPAEYQLAKNIAGLINFWAYDHLALMSWPLPFPTHNRRSTFMG